MNDITLGTIGKLPVYLSDTTGVPVEGVAYDDVTMWTRKAGGVLTAFTLTALNWTEIGGGHYEVTTTTGEANTLGALHYHCSASGVVDYPGVATIIAGIGGASFTDTYLDPDSSPIVGAEVRVFDVVDSTEPSLFNTETNVLCSFTIYLPADTYQARLDHPDYETKWQEVTTV